MRRRAAVLFPSLLLLTTLALVQGLSPTTGGVAGPAEFSDVSPSHQFYGHITWLAEEGIAEGFPDGGFHPQDPISRAAMAAFLYRVAGEPPFTPPGSATFTDVPTNHPFFAEIEWLAEEGITTGFGDGTFRSTAPTSRQAMAAYLYRATGEPDFTPPGTPSFPDVTASSQFFLAIEWLVAEEVTTGFPDGGYHPTEAVSRQAMAAFLFRQQHLAPTLTIDDDYVTGQQLPWDVAFLPDGRMLFTERNEGLRIREVGGTVRPLASDPTAPMDDLFPVFESGIMGLVLDPAFGTNSTFYTCQAEDDEGGGDQGPNAQIVQWSLSGTGAATAVTKEAELVELAAWRGPSGQDGRHGGCRLRFGPDGHLWVTAGDTACGSYPQDLGVLGGKVLRIDVDPVAESATAPGDNPFVGGPTADDLVYTYGHRNPQGLAWRPGTDQMWTAEHGPGVDDEVNLLEAGGNYGWNPLGSGPGSGCGYNEGVPMTDLAEFPNAVPAAWDTGGPTIATSGATFLEGDSWGGWEGALAVAVLKDQHLRLLFFTDSGVFVEERIPELLDHQYGRLRTPQMGPNQDLYLTTSNGGNDRVLGVSATP